MPIIAGNPVIPNYPEIVFNTDTSTLHIGDQLVTGIAAYAATDTLADRLRALEQELDRLKHLFTAEFAREIAERCEQFVSDREFYGMTDEEFGQSLQELLFERLGA